MRRPARLYKSRRRLGRRCPLPVMAGLDPAIHAFPSARLRPRLCNVRGAASEFRRVSERRGVDGRDKPGHDDSIEESCQSMPSPKKQQVKRVVLSYSGGLDTSIILKWLQTEYGAEVVTFTADLGQGEELEPARKKAEMLGVKPEHIFIEDVREEFVRDYVFPMFRANAQYEGQYLLGTSIARPLIAKHLVEIARKVGRRRDRPWRDRQGQRPGALRALGLRARARHQDHRALARVELRLAHRAHRLRRAAPDPDRQGQARRGAVLDRRQPSARLLRGQGARGPGARRRPPTSIRAPSIPRTRPTSRPSSRSRSRRAIRSPSTARR